MAKDIVTERSNAPGELLVRRGPYAGRPLNHSVDGTRAITPQQAKKRIEEFSFAEYKLVKPLNGAMTIRWISCPRFNESSLSALQTEFFECVEWFFRSRRQEVFFVWVRERSTGHGAHTHVAIHLGSSRTAICTDSDELKAYLDRHFAFDEDGIQIKPSPTPKSRGGWLRYMLKGLDGEAWCWQGDTRVYPAEVMQIDTERTGVIGIKRCGSSQNLGRKVREQAGWEEMLLDWEDCTLVLDGLEL